MKDLALPIFFIPCFLFSCILAAQNNFQVNPAYTGEVVEKLSTLILDHYVYEDVAQKTVNHLKEKQLSGYFEQNTRLDTFAKRLTRVVQSVNKDKHMQIWPRRQGKSTRSTPERMVENHFFQLRRSRERFAGFQEARKIEGNIGYLSLRAFAGPKTGIPAADRYMYLLASSDAIIIDLRRNGGGYPEMVQYLCSYFFDQPLLLNSLYYREGDRTEEYWVLDKVSGKKMPDVPLFVLTSKYTFSGAEEFAYNMQTRKRAVLIGETSGGGANPGDVMSINKELSVFIPTGAAVNPVTKTNWEGVGVVPDISTTAEEALDKAIELAKKAAEDFRQQKESKHKSSLLQLHKSLEILKAGDSFDPILVNLQSCLEKELLSEDGINRLGYEYLQNLKNAIAAEALFKGNTQLFPNSANTFDSYGEVLAHNGKFEKAIKNYQKAIDLAMANNDPNLELFKKNLAKVEEMAKEDR